MVSAEFYSSVESPWVLITGKPIDQHEIPKNVLLIELSGSAMTDLNGLYQELSTKLSFPRYFGENFNALDECLNDLDWLSADGYLLVIKNSDFLLKDESDEILEGFLSILSHAGEEWSLPVAKGSTLDRNGVPFHTLLEIDKDDTCGIAPRLKKMGIRVNSLKEIGVKS